MLILANSRPFEGVLVAVPVFGVLLLRLRKMKLAGLSQLFRKVALPLGMVLMLGIGCMTFYFWRVTGNPLEMPYQLHSAIYEVTGAVPLAAAAQDTRVPLRGDEEVSC